MRDYEEKTLMKFMKEKGFPFWYKPKEEYPT